MLEGLLDWHITNCELESYRINKSKLIANPNNVCRGGMKTALEDEFLLEAPVGATLTVSVGSVQIDIADNFKTEEPLISLAFLRPALKKRHAVETFRAVMQDFKTHEERWKQLVFKVNNPEKIVLKSHHEIAKRIRGGVNNIFPSKRLFLFAYNPEDRLAEFVRAISPRTNLIVLFTADYLQKSPHVIRNADIAIAIGPEPVNLAGANLLNVKAANDIAPLISSWINGWEFDRNKSLVPFFGQDADLKRLTSLLKDNNTPPATDLALLTAPASDVPHPTRIASQIRNASSARVKAGYISIAMRHKYWGILQNPEMLPHEIVSALLQAGLTVSNYKT